MLIREKKTCRSHVEITEIIIVRCTGFIKENERWSKEWTFDSFSEDATSFWRRGLLRGKEDVERTLKERT